MFMENSHPFFLRMCVTRSGRIDISAVESSWGESFVLFKTPNPERLIAPRTWPVVLASDRKGAGLEEGCLCLWNILNHSS